MFTYKLWEHYKEIKTETSVVLPYNYVYADEEVAEEFLIALVLTPVSLILDILTLPFQLIYLISKKLITYRIKRQRGKRN